MKRRIAAAEKRHANGNTCSAVVLMYKAKAYSAASATSPLASDTITRREPTPHDVQIET